MKLVYFNLGFYVVNMAEEKTVYSPMILKMERICRGYIDQLEKPDGKEMNFQNFMMMYIFGSCNNTEYRTKLFDHWPTVRNLTLHK